MCFAMVCHCWSHYGWFLLNDLVTLPITPRAGVHLFLLSHIMKKPMTRIDVISDVIGYDLWIILAIVLTLVLYITVFTYVRQKVGFAFN